MNQNTKSKRVWVILGGASFAGLIALLGLLLYSTEFFINRVNDSSGARIQATIISIEDEQKNLLRELVTASASDVSNNQNTIRQIEEAIAEKEATINALKAELDEPEDESNLLIENPTEPTKSSLATSVPKSTSVPTHPPSLGTIILSENSDNNYNWSEGGIYVTSIQVYEGEVAFISNGNNTFEKDLGIVGYESDEIRYISFKIYLLQEDASLLLQLRADRNWDHHRWGFDGRDSYEGAYTWKRQGQTVDLPIEEWVDVKLDLIDDLGLRPGQELTGLSFSGKDGNLIYDNVSLASSGSVTFCSNKPVVDNSNAQENVFLSSSNDFNDLNWSQGKLYKTSQLALQDDVAFIANGNNTTEGVFGIVGYGPNEIKGISFWVCLLNKDAALLLQTKIDNSWDHRWGIDGRNSYQGAYTWSRQGVTVNVPVNEWFQVTIDLIDDLEARPGQKLNGLAFSGADGNLVFDKVTFNESD